MAADYQVQPTIETDPMPHRGDTADDLSVWVHPANPSQSLIIGTDKSGAAGGFGVYNIDGSQHQFVTGGKLNNVDVMYNFDLGEQNADIVVATNRTNDTLAIYKVDPATRTLSNITGATATGLVNPYGLALYHSSTGKRYAFASDADGTNEVRQYELTYNAQAGMVDATVRRTFDPGTVSEGLVVDHFSGKLYVGEENVGIWQYGAEPTVGTTRTAIDTVGGGGHLAADIEGLTIYYGSNNDGYLIASSQGASEFVAYDRNTGAYVTTFDIAATATIDDTTGTDGVDVSNVNFGAGSGFEHGLFIAHDTSNSGADAVAGTGSNFKLVPWESIANGATPDLLIDTGFDPRSIPEPTTLLLAGCGLVGLVLRKRMSWT